MIMKGYHNRPDATAETLRNGWLHTGDIGYLDEEGWLFIVDRKKDMIIRGGENIYPAELEEVLYRHPAVAEAAVVGLPDPVYGERVVAFVVKKKGQEAGAAEIIAFMKKNVTSFKCP
jgi:long-chain acyl-CoA synthetase